MSPYTAKEQHLVITAPNLAACKAISHGFFTREGGVSHGLYASLNCGLGSKDERAHVLQNRAYVAGMLGFASNQLVANAQVHSTIVTTVTHAWAPENAPQADGLVTNVPGILLAAAGADCGVILWHDPVAKVVGACHAGWRGAKNGILESTLAAMVALGASPANIRAALGPTISAPAYEVGEDLHTDVLIASPWASNCFTQGAKPEKFQFNLPHYIAQRLQHAGISNFHDTHRCTLSEPAHFFSYRRSVLAGEPDYGRHLHGIGLKG